MFRRQALLHIVHMIYVVTRFCSDEKSPVSDVMNTTDEKLAAAFGSLTLHSPQSSNRPATKRQPIRADQFSDVSKTSQSQSKHENSRNPGMAVRLNVSTVVGSPRTMLECMVPKVAVYMDKLRLFWPFGRRGKAVAYLTSCETENTGNPVFLNFEPTDMILLYLS